MIENIMRHVCMSKSPINVHAAINRQLSNPQMHAKWTNLLGLNIYYVNKLYTDSNCMMLIFT